MSGPLASAEVGTEWSICPRCHRLVERDRLDQDCFRCDMDRLNAMTQEELDEALGGKERADALVACLTARIDALFANLRKRSP